MAISSVDRAQLYTSPEPLVRPLVLWVMRLTTVLAIGVTAYITWLSFSGADSVGCSGGFDCDEVLNSGWSTWFGIPVAAPALSLYVTLFGTLAFSGPLAPENVRRLAWTTSLCLCALAGAAALWFIGLQWLALGKYCSWCLTAHMCGLGLATLAVLTARNGLARLQGAAMSAVVGVALLAVGQIFGPAKETPQLQRVAINTPPITTHEAPPQAVTTQRLTLDDLYSTTPEVPPNDPPTLPTEDETDPPPAIPTDDPPLVDDLQIPPVEQPPAETPASGQTHRRVVGVFRNSAQLDLYQHPVVGSPEAEFVVVKLFDYTCPHCRMMHEHLEAARREFGAKLVIVMCPVPLNKQCNPHVAFENAKHAEACDLARLAIAVWQADPTKFAEFHDWLFAPPVHPSADNARAKAIELVGEKQLAEQLYGDKLRERLAIGPKLYKLVGAGVVPKLLLPTGMLVGPGENDERVIAELKQEFTAPPTADVLP